MRWLKVGAVLCMVVSGACGGGDDPEDSGASTAGSFTFPGDQPDD